MTPPTASRKSVRRAMPETDEIDASGLEKLNHEELLALTRDLLKERRPGTTPPLDPEAIASSVAASLNYDPEPAWYAIGKDVGPYVDRAREAVRQERHEDALQYAIGIIRGYTQGYDPGFDHESMATYDLNEAVQVADSCLAHVDEAALRHDAFEALKELWLADRSHGGVGLADGVPEAMRLRCTSQERAELAAWAKERLAHTRNAYDRETQARLFLALGGDALDDEAYLEFCRDNGFHFERLERLLTLGRTQHAADAARLVKHHRLTEAAALLVSAKHGSLAVEVVRHGLADEEARHYHDRYRAWLQRHAEASNDLVEARRIAHERFREEPNLATYTALRSVAKRCRTWPVDEQEVLGLLRHPENSALLTEVHLAERRVGDALKSLQVLDERYRHGWGHDELRKRVATAAQKGFPEEARDIFLHLADGLISRKTRAYYAQAAPLIKQASELDRRVNRDDPRHRVVDDLRRQYGNYPALWDELRKAGVGGIP